MLLDATNLDYRTIYLNIRILPRSFHCFHPEEASHLMIWKNNNNLPCAYQLMRDYFHFLLDLSVIATFRKPLYSCQCWWQKCTSFTFCFCSSVSNCTLEMLLTARWTQWWASLLMLHFMLIAVIATKEKKNLSISYVLLVLALSWVNGAPSVRGSQS